MNIELLPEPEVEFAGGFRHVDPRFGILHHGPLDKGTDRGLTEVRVGIVGTAETVEKVAGWILRCSGGVDAKKSRQPNLFPRFPGFNEGSAFGIRLVLDERLQRTLRATLLEPIIAHANEAKATDDAVTLFLDAAREICGEGPAPHVIVCAPSSRLLDALEGTKADSSDEEHGLDEGADEQSPPHESRPAFHDVLKARALSLACPLQMIRERTYAPSIVSPRPNPPPRSGPRVQDEATRAWNFFTALYHKAGGALWRLARVSSDLATCYVGTSFYRTRNETRVMASVAQVFNERGDGMIVRGGQAIFHKDDRQPHLNESDAFKLLRNAVEAYRDEHKTSPARIVLHKTSSFSTDEIAGLKAAAEAERIEFMDLVWVRRSWLRLYRTKTYPPLRGMWLRLGDREGIVYLRGSVTFFATFPGLYVPRPLEYVCARLDSTGSKSVAEELMALSKLNWNNTQFDGGEPITVRAARRVGDIMKNLPEGAPSRARFKYFM
jgi:hypothetical protein